MLKELFDLHGLEKHGDLFGASERPWEWLKRLEAYLWKFSSRTPLPQLEEGVHLDRTSGPIHIEEGARIQFGAVICGPAFIGRDSVIGYHALVSGSLILDKCTVGHCSQVKSSIFLPGAKAPHFNYVGDSVLGREVNLGAGCKTGNLPLDSKPNSGISVAWGDQKIDTGLKKLGAFIGDGTKIGCNCVLNPGAIIGKGCRVYNQATVSGWTGTFRRIRPDVRLRITKQVPGT